jgi:hypothetical protein
MRASIARDLGDARQRRAKAFASAKRHNYPEEETRQAVTAYLMMAKTIERFAVERPALRR